MSIDPRAIAFADLMMTGPGCPQCGERGPCLCALTITVGPPRYLGPAIEVRLRAPSSPPAIPASVDRTPIPGGRRQ